MPVPLEIVFVAEWITEGIGEGGRVESTGEIRWILGGVEG